MQDDWDLDTAGSWERCSDLSLDTMILLQMEISFSGSTGLSAKRGMCEIRDGHLNMPKAENGLHRTPCLRCLYLVIKEKKYKLFMNFNIDVLYRKVAITNIRG